MDRMVDNADLNWEAAIWVCSMLIGLILLRFHTFRFRLRYDCAQTVAGRRPPPSTTTEQMTLSRQADGRWVIVAMAER